MCQSCPQIPCISLSVSVNTNQTRFRIPSTDAQERGIDLSSISQSSLAGIELYKALTPDKDADAIAGSVNFVTKKAPSEREVRAVLRGGYNDLMNSAKQYDFQLKYGERFFGNKSFKISISSGSYS